MNVPNSGLDGGMDSGVTATSDGLWLRIKRHFTEAFAEDSLAGPGVRSRDGREWMHRHRRGAYRYVLCFLAASLLPVVAHNFYVGLPWLAWGVALLEAVLFLDIAMLSLGRRAVVSPLVILSAAISLDIVLMYAGHGYALYLLFPMLIALPVLLPGRSSLPVMLATMVLVAPAALMMFQPVSVLVAGFSLAVCWVVSSWQVFALKAQARHLRGMAITDPLTGAYNRRYMELRAAKGIEAWTRYRRDETLLILDIDHFKRINDEFGHSVGDRALEALVTILRDRVRAADTLCRFGGEEFVLLLSETAAERALQVAEALRVAIERADILPDGAMTVSIGVCHVGEAKTVDQWFQLADRALYVAKARGRNCVELATAARFSRSPRS